MNELIPLIAKHIRMVLRYRWVALGGAFFFCLAGWTAVKLIPPTYEVTAKLFFDSRSMLQPLLEGLAVESVFNLQADSVQRLLLQRKSLEKIAREGGFDVDSGNPVAFQRMLTKFSSRIGVSNAAENVFTISYRDQDAKRGVRVVEELLNMFLQESRGENRANASQSKQFLDEQIRQYQERLNRAEDKLWRFKEKNFALLSKQEDYFSRLRAFSDQIDETGVQLKEALGRREQIMEQLKQARLTGIVDEADFKPLPSIPQDPVDERISRWQDRLDELLTKYTVRHPEVVSVQRTLDQLLQSKVNGLRESPQANTDADGEREPVGNPMYRNLKLSLAAADAEVAAIQARLKEFQRRQDQLKATVNSSLEVEAEFQRLNRSYSIDKSQFEEFVKRRELLNVTNDAVQDKDLDLQAKVLEEPVEPVLPTRPSDTLLNLGVLLGGLGAGIALAWLLAMMRPVIYTRQELEEMTDLPVWGTVAMVLTPTARWLRGLQNAAFFAGWMGLAAVSYGVVAQAWFNA